MTKHNTTPAASAEFTAEQLKNLDAGIADVSAKIWENHPNNPKNKKLSASRHTPEPWFARGHEIFNATTGERIACVLLNVGDEPNHDEVFSGRIVEEHNALAGMNPEALPALLDACAWYLSVNSCENRAKMRAALAALKGSK